MQRGGSSALPGCRTQVLAEQALQAAICARWRAGIGVALCLIRPSHVAGSNTTGAIVLMAKNFRKPAAATKSAPVKKPQSVNGHGLSHDDGGFADPDEAGTATGFASDEEAQAGWDA